jgi:NAD(P)H-hydrate epimerase
MYLSCEAVRRLDRRASEDFGIPGVVLMENAGRGAAELLRSLGIQGTVIICCGKGNNGGDGLVMARHLDNFKLSVRVLFFGRPGELTGDAAVNLRIVERSGIPLEVHAETSVEREPLRRQLTQAGWIVDALFGTGLHGAVRAPFDGIIEAINASGMRVFAVDIPSGLDGDTGQPLGATVRAQHTATFVAKKTGFAEPGAHEWLGQVHVLDIGAPRRLVEEMCGRP